MEKYIKRVDTTRQVFEEIPDADEYITRQCIQGLMQDIPIDDLKRIFTVTKIDPESEESKKILMDVDASRHLKDLIHRLRDNRTIRYEVEIKVQ